MGLGCELTRSIILYQHKTPEGNPEHNMVSSSRDVYRKAFHSMLGDLLDLSCLLNLELTCVYSHSTGADSENAVFAYHDQSYSYTQCSTRKPRFSNDHENAHKSSNNSKTGINFQKYIVSLRLLRSIGAYCGLLSIGCSGSQGFVVKCTVN